VAIGAGMALAARIAGSRRKVYVVLGDGELNSGVIWEGLMVAAKFGLDNLKVIVDYNGVQQTGTTSHVMPTEPIVDKWASFNWHVMEIHGHNMSAILDALDQADEIHGRPTVIIARTTKGKGVSFMENSPKWHGGVPNQEQFDTALAELREGAEQWQA
jgi:transketolase